MLSPADLDSALSIFYVAVKPAPADTNTSKSSIRRETYSKSSYVNVRAGINRYLRLPPNNRQINLMGDKEFQHSNHVFVGALKKLREAGKDLTSHKTPILKEDVQKMNAMFEKRTPWSLLYKVFFDISFHFARRGREGLRELKKTSFKFEMDGEGQEYVTIGFNETEKTKQGNEKSIFEKSGTMYSQPGSKSCPVESLRFYLTKLHPDCDALFQYPKSKFTQNSQYWYNCQPLGKGPLSELMKRISLDAGLSKVYTNHCIRATSITVLSHAGVEAQQIQSVSGHKSVESLKHYIQAPAQHQKKSMSTILHDYGTHDKITPPAPQSTANITEHDNSLATITPPTSKNENTTVDVSKCSNAFTNAPLMLSGMFTGSSISGNININFNNYTTQN